MSKILSILGTILLVAITILGLGGNLWRLIVFLEDVGGGSLIKGVVMLPFMLLGAVQIIRCGIFLFSSDAEKFKNSIVYILYVIASIVGIALIVFNNI